MARTFFWLTVFSVAMAYLETSVVVYLRMILYPEGFDFPLKPISHQIVVVELWREAATILMLIGAGVLAGKKSIQRFAFFIYGFAIWDVFYYVFLKVLIDWPESLFTWDVLFLLPVTWTGPVIAPVIVSLLMILLTVELVFLSDRIDFFKVKKVEWFLLIFGSVVVIVSFCWDYSAYILSNHGLSKLWSMSNEELFDVSIQYIPSTFNWALFIAGILIILSSSFLIFKRSYPKLK